MAQEQYIKNYLGQILGIIETDANGDQTARDFPSRLILGFYRKDRDQTTDLQGRIVANGNAIVNLIYQEKAKQGKN